MATLALAALVFTASPALADEYGVEREAPTLFTGETILVSLHFRQHPVKKGSKFALFFNLIELT
jgi:transposase